MLKNRVLTGCKRDIGVKINFVMGKLSVYSVNLAANANLYNFVLEIFLR